LDRIYGGHRENQNKTGLEGTNKQALQTNKKAHNIATTGDSGRGKQESTWKKKQCLKKKESKEPKNKRENLNNLVKRIELVGEKNIPKERQKREKIRRHTEFLKEGRDKKTEKKYGRIADKPKREGNTSTPKIVRGAEGRKKRRKGDIYARRLEGNGCRNQKLEKKRNASERGKPKRVSKRKIGGEAPGDRGQIVDKG